jgi:hypothetical protein
MDKQKRNELPKDYLDFINNEGVEPPLDLSNRVLHLIRSEMKPAHGLVLGKLILVQAFIGAITMIFCPQFSFSLTNNHDVFHFFHHKFGEYVCMIICGTIFMGTGALFASFLMKKGEVQRIRESRLLYYFTISILFMSIFLLMGADIYLRLVLFWLIGSVIGGALMFEVSRLVKQKLLRL